MTVQTIELFESKLCPEPNTGCWLWTGCRNWRGYGLVQHGKTRPAHRVAYELYKGSIPDGMQLDHKCRQRACVNPDHLEPVTGKENVLRGEGVTAANARKTHCVRGHELEKTMYRDKRGHRICRACQAARYAEKVSV